MRVGGSQNAGDETSQRRSPGFSRGGKRSRRAGKQQRRLLLQGLAILAGLVLLLAAGGGWLYYRALEIRTEIVAASELVPEFKNSLVTRDDARASAALVKLQAHVEDARSAATDPLWKTAAAIPGIGKNFSVVSELVLSADDALDGAAQPLLSAYKALDWEALKPVDGKFDLAALAASSPSIVSAANTIDLTYTRLAGIDDKGLIREVAQPLDDVRTSLDDLRQTLNIAADTSRILPSMMGVEGPRNYLVLVQNNAEIRATGGLPGALAVLRLEKGTVSLVDQSSGAALGKFSPPVKVDPRQIEIYSKRLGSYISDVNLTPDFPTAAKSAKSMWEARHETKIDGVIALDPVVLSHILKASGPVTIPSVNPELDQRLPATLTADNVVKVLLSDVYSSTDANDAQDEYFAAVSREVFAIMSSGSIPTDLLLSALNTSAEEHRLLVWSTHNDEQKVLEKAPVGGAISGPAVGGAAFGVYFNDGTGAKMDYHVRRTVKLTEKCTAGGYAEYVVKVTLKNTAPREAAAILPLAVTGGGRFGTPPGSVQTNVVVYGPALSHLDTTLRDKTRVAFASHLHNDRPVGVITTRLAPGSAAEIEMTFVKVVQHTDPVVVVTPTAQEVKDVLLPLERATCSTGEK